MDSTKTFGRIEKNLNKFSKLNVFIHCGKVAERAAPQFKKEYTFFFCCYLTQQEVYVHVNAYNEIAG